MKKILLLCILVIGMGANYKNTIALAKAMMEMSNQEEKVEITVQPGDVILPLPPEETVLY